MLALLLLVGCQAKVLSSRAVPGDEGRLVIYLQGLPQGAERLRFSLEGVDALRIDGAVFPLELRFAELDGRVRGRQRLLTAANLPPGAYRGLQFAVGKASVRTEDGEAALVTPDAPVAVDAPFTITARGATLLEAAYQHTGSIQQKFMFNPVFSAYLPPPPVSNRVGYVTSGGERQVTVFDRKTLEVAGLVGVGPRPAGLALDETMMRAYVAVSGEDAVDALDMVSGEILGRILLQTGDRPEELALTPDGRVLLAVNAGSNTVSVIDPQSYVELNRVAVGEKPLYVVLDRQGRHAYVFNQRSDSISVIDPERGEVVATIGTEAGPIRGAFNRAGDRLYVIHRDSPYLFSYDTSSLLSTGRVFVGMEAAAILVDSATDLIYLGRHHVPRVDIYDPFSLLPVDFLEVPGGVVDMVIDDEENRLLLAVPEKELVVSVDLIGKGVEGIFDVGTGAHSVDLMRARR